MFEKATTSEGIWELVRDVLGLTNKEDLFEVLPKCKIGIQNFVTGLLSAAINLYVFQETKVEISQRLECWNELGDEYQKEMSAGMYCRSMGAH